MENWHNLAKNKSKKHWQAKSLLLCTLILTWEFSFPYVAVAQQSRPPFIDAGPQILASHPTGNKEVDSRAASEPSPKRIIKVVATAYSSTPEQTDDTPCITANGFDVCQNNQVNVVAANFLPFGTKIRIPELYGNNILVVQDRMNARYGYGRIDIWHPSKTEAVQFGVKRIKIEIY